MPILKKTIIEEAINIFGKQALIAVLPYRVRSEKLNLYCQKQRFGIVIWTSLTHIAMKFCFTTENEGMAFCNVSDHSQLFSFDPSKIIFSGGINFDFIKRMRNSKCASICIDNSALHQEFNFNQL